MRPNVINLTEAIRAGLILKVQHRTGGTTETLREVIPIAIGVRNGRVYWRGLHYLGGSASNAADRSFRLFRLDRTSDIEQDGNSSQKTPMPAGYTMNDSFFTSRNGIRATQRTAFNSGTAYLYLIRNKARLRRMYGL